MSLNFCPKCGGKLDPDASFCPACGAKLKVKKEAPQAPVDSGVSTTTVKPQPVTVRYAGFWDRLFALILDSIVIAIIGSILSFIIFVSWVPFNIFDPFGGWWYVSFPFDWLIGFLYHWGMEAGNSGQTLGKLALNIRTVDEETLELTTSSNYAVNNIFKSSPFLILDLIFGVIKNYGDPKNQLRIMQNVSNTVVIKSR